MTLGPHMNAEQATHRIKEWCCRGLDIADGLGARLQHMSVWNPRRAGPGDLRTLAELDALAGA